MSEPQKSRCAWLCCLLSLIGVIALVLVMMHRADDGIHTPDGSIQTGTDQTGGDEEPGSKKFDHLILFNVGPVDIKAIKVTLINDGGEALALNLDLDKGDSHFFPIQQDGLGVKKVILTYEYPLPGKTMVRTRTIEVFDPASDEFCIRAATFWCELKIGPGELPRFWGHGLLVHSAQEQNTVAPNLNPTPDVELP